MLKLTTFDDHGLWGLDNVMFLWPLSEESDEGLSEAVGEIIGRVRSPRVRTVYGLPSKMSDDVCGCHVGCVVTNSAESLFRFQPSTWSPKCQQIDHSAG